MTKDLKLCWQSHTWEPPEPDTLEFPAAERACKNSLLPPTGRSDRSLWFSVPRLSSKKIYLFCVLATRLRQTLLWKMMLAGVMLRWRMFMPWMARMPCRICRTKTRHLFSVSWYSESDSRSNRFPPSKYNVMWSFQDVWLTCQVLGDQYCLITLVNALNNLNYMIRTLQTPQYLHLRVAVNSLVLHVLCSVDWAIFASVFNTEHLGVTSIGELKQLK